MHILSRFFWTKIHRSDASVSWRWAIFTSATLCLMPTFGSALTVVSIGMAIVALVFLAFDWRRLGKLTGTEIAVASIFVAYFGLSLLSTQVHDNRSAGLWEMEGNVGFIVMLPLLPVLRFSARPYWRDWIPLGIGLGGVLVGAAALLGARTSARAEAFVGNPQILAYLSASTGLFCFVLLVLGKSRFWPVYAAGLAGSAISLAMAGGRAAIVYFVLTAGLVFLTLLPRLGRLNWRQWVIVTYLAFCSIAIVYETVDDTPIFAGLAQRSAALVDMIYSDSHSDDGDQSLEMRKHMAQVGWQAAMKSPLFGYGRQNMMAVANEQSADDAYLRFTHLHNAYLTELVSSGVIGLLAFLMVLVAPVIVTWRAPAPWKTMGISFALFTALFSATAIGFYHDIKVSYFCMVVVALNALARLTGPDPSEQDEGGHRHVEFERRAATGKIGTLSQ